MINRKTFWVISLMFSFFIFLPLSFASIDSDTDGPLPEYFSRFFTNGSTNSMVGDFSTVPRNFTAGPASDVTWRISRLIITIKDANINNFADYGAISTLTNGIVLGVVRNNVTTDFNPLRTTVEEFTIKTNGDWASVMFDLDIKNLGAGDDYVVGRWTFDAASTKIRLEGSKGDFLFVQLSDDLSGLSDHLIMIQGYEELTPITQAEVNRMLTAIISILVISFILLIIGIWQEDWNFIFSSGFLFSIIAIYIFMNGLPNFNNWVSDSLAIVLIGFGAYLLFRASVESLNEASG